jgi:hypothetical protein
MYGQKRTGYNKGTIGLAGLLKGLAAGQQQARENKLAEEQHAWKNPDRPIGLRDLFGLLAEEQKAQNLYSGLMPGTFQPQAVDPNKYINLFRSLQSAMTQPQAQAPAMGPRNPVTGSSNFFDPNDPAVVAGGGAADSGVDPDLLAMIKVAQSRGLKVGIQR